MQACRACAAAFITWFCPVISVIAVAFPQLLANTSLEGILKTFVPLLALQPFLSADDMVTRLILAQNTRIPSPAPDAVRPVAADAALPCRDIEAKTRRKLTGGEVDINDVYAAGKDEAKEMALEAEKEDELEFDLSEPAPAAA